MNVSTLKLHTGGDLPTVGLGLWKVEKPAVPSLVAEAARCGYRHFDCASDYGNEAEVGVGPRRTGPAPHGRSRHP